MPSFLYQAPSGVLGDVTRANESNVEPIMQDSQFSAYGFPVVYSGDGQAAPFGGSNVAADFAGILVRTAPAISGNTNEGFSDTIPNLEQPQGLLVRGYATVKCVAGTPVRGGAVFVQVTASGGVAVGELRATDDGSNAIELSKEQAEWASNGKDADNLAEIRIKA